jgi:hypothetical protein
MDNSERSKKPALDLVSPDHLGMKLRLQQIAMVEQRLQALLVVRIEI